MSEVLKESRNGTTVEIAVENGKSFVKLYGKPSKATRAAAYTLQYSVMPPQWVLRQIVKTI